VSSCESWRRPGGLSHAIPNATTEQVLQAALRLLLEKQDRARGLVKRPRKTVTITPTGTPAKAQANQTAPAAQPTGSCLAGNLNGDPGRA